MPLSAKDYIPSKLNRKKQGIANISYWKAAEHRLFLLYAGLIILIDKNILAKQLYVLYILKFARSKFEISFVVVILPMKLHLIVK